MRNPLPSERASFFRKTLLPLQRPSLSLLQISSSMHRAHDQRTDRLRHRFLAYRLRPNRYPHQDCLDCKGTPRSSTDHDSTQMPSVLPSFLRTADTPWRKEESDPLRAARSTGFSARTPLSQNQEHSHQHEANKAVLLQRLLLRLRAAPAKRCLRLRVRQPVSPQPLHLIRSTSTPETDSVTALAALEHQGLHRSAYERGSSGSQSNRELAARRDRRMVRLAVSPAGSCAAIEAVSDQKRDGLPHQDHQSLTRLSAFCHR